jgi:excisionase family DNA binding protein
VSVPRHTARLARQFHASGAIESPPGQADIPTGAITRESLVLSLQDVYSRRTLTPSEAAEILKCSVKTVHRIFRRMPGIVPVGKTSYLIPRSLFESWLQERMSKVA